MKLKKGILVKTNYGSYCLITKVEGNHVFGIWMATTYLDVSNQAAFRADDTKELTKATETETRNFTKNIFEFFDKGFVKISV